MRGKPPARQHLAFVAELAAMLRDMEKNPQLSAEERGRLARWKENAVALESVVRDPTAAATHALDLTDLSDLPPALLDELSVAHADPLEAQIAAVLRSCGGRADLDQVLIGLYRQFDTIQKRRFLQNKLWRMVRKGQVRKAKGERGLFSLPAAKERTRKGRRKA